MTKVKKSGAYFKKQDGGEKEAPAVVSPWMSVVRGWIEGDQRALHIRREAVSSLNKFAALCSEKSADLITLKGR